MKVLVNPDSVPTTLQESLDNIKTYLDGEDVGQLQHYDHNPFLTEKIGAAKFLVGAWSLGDGESRLVMWFNQEYGVKNGDQIAEMILDCLFCDVKGIPRRDKELASKFSGKKKKEVKKE